VSDRCLDAGALLGDRAGELDEWLQATSPGLPQPRVEQHERVLERDAVDLAQLLGEQVSAVQPLVELLHTSELLLLALAQVGWVLPERLAFNVKRALNRLYYLWWGSLLRTLATKHKTTVQKVASHLRTPDGEYVARYMVDGKPYQSKVFKLKHLDRSPIPVAGVDAAENLGMWINRRSEIVERLNARTCELCGRSDRPVEIHHVRKLADMKKSPLWVRLESARIRKRIVLCVACHDAVHAGRLPR
jgi:Type II intron maturase